jgi:CHAT domain-containing protein/tetratricopeptide (TPR) repeat protein
MLLLSLLLAAQAPDSTPLLYAWRDIWRKPFDSTIAALQVVAAEARRTGNRGDLASAHLGMGFLHSRKGGVPPALAHLDTALRTASPGRLKDESNIRCTRGSIRTFAGLPGAAEDVRLGLLRGREARSLSAVGWCQFAFASVALNESRNPGLVLAYLDSALVSQQAAGDTDWIGINHFTRGYLLHFLGDLAGAKRALAEARRVGAGTGNVFTSAWVHRFLGDIHAATGDWVSADRDYRAANTQFAFLGDALGLRGIDRSLASAAMAVGRLEAAEATLLRSRDEAKAAGMAEGVYHALLELAAIKWLRGDYAGSREETERAAEFGLRTGHQAWVHQLGYHRGLHALRLGELGRAERYLRTWLRDISPAQIQSRYSARARLAEILVRQGRLAEGLTEITGAMDQLDSLRATLDDRALRLLLFQTRTALDEPDLGLATIVSALVRAGQLDAAFALTERRRARELADGLLRDRYVSDIPGQARAGDSPRPVADPAVLRTGLPEGTVLLSYLAGREGQPSTAFVLSAAGIQAEILPSFDGFAADADRLGALLAAGEPAEAVAERLSRALVQPVVARIPPGTRVIEVVADGFLHRLPFDLFPLADGRPVLERFAVGMVPSAGIARALSARPAHRDEPRVLAFGDPRFAQEASGAGLSAAVYRDAFDSTGGLPRLPASADEARFASRHGAESVVRLREAASEAFLKSVAPDWFRVVHFATHALVDERTPARTALALAPGGGEDGFLGPAELVTLGLHADLIVLSACRTAGGMAVEGEGIQGLTAPLLEGGARSVIATLWPIADRHAGGFVRELYAALSQGKPVAEALRDAKLARRRAGAPLSEWAAFVIVGDPLTAIPLRPASGRPVGHVVIGALAVLALAFLVWRVTARSASAA